MSGRFKKPGQPNKSPQQRVHPRHMRVINLYFTRADFVWADACRMAGYAKDRHDIFQRPEVQEEIERRHRAIREKYEVSYEKTIGALAEAAYANIMDFGRINEDGQWEVDFSKADRRALGAIGKIKTKEYFEGKGDDKRLVRVVTVEPRNKNTAADLLLRHAGLSKDKTGQVLTDIASRLDAGRRRVGLDRGEEEEDSG